jgi:pimeloyl-ACP methyl ester carboxylesterase
VEAAQALDAAVMVGHSTGGMFMLSVPELAEHLSGMALVSSAPHAGWRAAFAQYVKDHPNPAVDAAAEHYAQQPNDQNLRALTVAAVPWNFSEPALTAGRCLFEALPYNHNAVAWADAHFDDTYQARWAPESIPTLIVSGTQDRVVSQRLWADEPAFTGPTVLRRQIEGAGHLPWIEDPDAVRAAFADLTEQLDSRAG